MSRHSEQRVGGSPYPDRMTMSISSIKSVVSQAQRQAGAIARGNPESEQVRILAIAIAETARAVGDLSKRVDDLDD